MKVLELFSVDTYKLGGEVKGLNPSWGEAVFCIENVEKDDLDKISVELTIKDAFPWSRVPGAEKTKRMVEIVTCKVEFQRILSRAEMR